MFRLLLAVLITGVMTLPADARDKQNGDGSNALKEAADDVKTFRNAPSYEPPKTFTPSPAAIDRKPEAQASSFERMVAETGCASDYSDDKKADIFNANYKGREMTATGQIATLSSEKLSLKVLPSTMTFDIQVKLRDPKAGYDLEKGQRVTVKFIVTYHGGCFLSYSGEQGEIVRR